MKPNRTVANRVSRRAATLADRDFLFHLRTATMKEYVRQVFGDWNDAWQRKFFDQRFNPAGIEILVVDGQDVGALQLTRRKREIWLTNIHVLPRWQNRGIGTAVLREILAAADRRRLPVGLQVLKVNPARRFYERAGFRIAAQTTTHFRMRRPAPRRPKKGRVTGAASSGP